MAYDEGCYTPRLKGNLRRDLFLSGSLGLLIGASVYAGASALSVRIPILLQGIIVLAMALVIFLALALLEIPLMVFGLRQMARSTTTPRRVVLVTFGIFVAFAAVYASLFVLLTGQITLGLVIVAVCVARLGSGVWVR